MKLLFLGDLMPGGKLHYHKLKIGNSVNQYMDSCDFRIATLECAMGENMPMCPVKMQGRQNIIHSPSINIEILKQLNINAVSLANNHLFDLCLEGYENTIRLLDELGISYFGAGRNIAEARKPLVINKHGVSIAIFAFSQYGSFNIGYVPVATEESFGVNPLDMETLSIDIKQAKKDYDYVYVMPHWGNEFLFSPSAGVIDCAKELKKLGVDGIFGGHTHIIQSTIKSKSCPIAYSLGNFIFPDFYTEPIRPTYYPEEEPSSDTIKTIYNYPFPIENYSLRIWPEIYRYSLFATIEINKGKNHHFSKKYSYYTLDNCLEFKSPDIFIKLILWSYSVAVRSNLSLCIKCVYFTERVYRKLRKIFYKNNQFNC